MNVNVPFPAPLLSALLLPALLPFEDRGSGYRFVEILFQNASIFYSLHLNNQCLKNFRCISRHSLTILWKRQGRGSLNNIPLRRQVFRELTETNHDRIYFFLQKINDWQRNFVLFF